ncbi:MAG: transcriptional regulator, partial [Bacilli bacterium]
PSVEVVIKLANVLQVDIDTILSPIIKQDNPQLLEKEWVDFISELKRSGLHKDQLHHYKPLIEFIQWQKQTKNKD